MAALRLNRNWQSLKVGDKVTTDLPSAGSKEVREILAIEKNHNCESGTSVHMSGIPVGPGIGWVDAKWAMPVEEE